LKPVDLPILFDSAAIFLFGLTGALEAVRRGYDFVGLFALTLVTGAGGGLIRDGLFIQNGPPQLAQHWALMSGVILASVTGYALGEHVHLVTRNIALIEAAGLGFYSVVGVQISMANDLSIPASVLVGVINSCGGGLLRDILIKREPLMFHPGEFYVLAVLMGCGSFVLFITLGMADALAAFLANFVTFSVRILALRFRWRTKSVIRPNSG
jgi:uncharacterized membrane protein YeiH